MRIRRRLLSLVVFISALRWGEPVCEARELSLDSAPLYYEAAYEVALFLGAPRLIKPLRKGQGEGRKRLPYQAFDDALRPLLHKSKYYPGETDYEKRLNAASGTINRGLRGGALLAVPFLLPKGHRLGAYMSMLHAVETWYFSSQLFRAIIGRYRPRTYYAEPPDFNTLKMDSHPSGHAGEAFVWATIATKTLHLGAGWKLGVYSLAAVSSLLRARGGQHFASDLLAGAALGAGVAMATYGVLHSPADESEEQSGSDLLKGWKFTLGPSLIEASYRF